MDDLANFRMGPLPPPDQKEMDERIHDMLLTETARSAWLKWAEKHEQETVWRRDQSGTPGNRAIDEAMFIEGFKQGANHALQERT